MRGSERSEYTQIGPNGKVGHQSNENNGRMSLLMAVEEFISGMIMAGPNSTRKCRERRPLIEPFIKEK